MKQADIALDPMSGTMIDIMLQAEIDHLLSHLPLADQLKAKYPKMSDRIDELARAHVSPLSELQNEQQNIHENIHSEQPLIRGRRNQHRQLAGGSCMKQIDERDFMASLNQQVEKALIEAAEPVIQAALKDAEDKMRQALATSVFTMMQYSVESRRNELLIRVEMPGTSTREDLA